MLHVGTPWSSAARQRDDVDNVDDMGGGGGGGGTLIDREVVIANGVPVSWAPMLFQPVIRGMASRVTRAVAMDARQDPHRGNVFVNLRKIEYVMREPLHVRALEIEEKLQKVRG